MVRIALFLLLTFPIFAQTPFGGDFTTLNAGPSILAGTSNGKLYRLNIETWVVIPSFSHPSHFVEAILQDGNSIYVALSTDTGGKVVFSPDAGQTWRDLGLEGHSVRGLSKNANTLVAVARDGVFRFEGEWRKLSPDSIVNLHSVAIHPTNSNFIYAGTTHLPRRTFDGGKSWQMGSSASTGMIDDSDVFSIRFSQLASDMFISACSGIYHSQNLGKTWKKMQGIPFESRRTHSIYEHPTQPNILFAATTAGLWRSGDRGKTWKLVSDVRTTFNAVQADPQRPTTLYAAADDWGAFRSLDNGLTWQPFNQGIIARYIASYLVDTHQYCGTAFDPQNGGLYRDGVLVLPGLSIFTITKLDRYYAGTNQGLYASEDGINWNRTLGPEHQIYAIGKVNNMLLAGGTDGLYIGNTLHPIGTVQSIADKWIASTNGLFMLEDDTPRKLDFPGHAPTLLFANANTLFVATNSGFWINKNGSWKKRGNGISEISQIKTIWFDGRYHAFCARTNTLYTSLDGEAWEASKRFTIPGKPLFYIPQLNQLSIWNEGLLEP